MPWLPRWILKRCLPPTSTGPEPGERGAWAETQVSVYLRGQGLRQLARNYRCPGGEIDLVMQDGAVLVFVEVRYRSRDDFGSALESVDRPKQRRVLRCARHYQQAHPLQARRLASRFDIVLAGPGDSPQHPELRWLKDAFRED